ncbi:hypothetical protein NC651_018007 [Populus alba x Populus x berolinensis]|nr:hypothetical protein NC651_018007 [Populus alba x Populus x berolinensis]
MIPAARTDVNHTIHARLNPSLGIQTGEMRRITLHDFPSCSGFTPASSMAPRLFAVACELDGIYVKESITIRIHGIDPSDKRRIPCDVKLKELFDIDCSKTLFRSFCEGLTLWISCCLFSGGGVAGFSSIFEFRIPSGLIRLSPLRLHGIFLRL